MTIISKLVKERKKDLNILVTTERALQPHLLSKKLFIDKKLCIQKGVKIEIKELITTYH